MHCMERFGIINELDNKLISSLSSDSSFPFESCLKFILPFIHVATEKEVSILLIR